MPQSSSWPGSAIAEARPRSSTATTRIAHVDLLATAFADVQHVLVDQVIFDLLRSLDAAMRSWMAAGRMSGMAKSSHSRSTARMTGIVHIADVTNSLCRGSEQTRNFRSV